MFQLFQENPAPPEIGRRFLVHGEDWRQAVTIRSTRLCEGVLGLGDGRTARIRLHDDRVTLTVKGARQEMEYRVPTSDGLLLMEQQHQCTVLEKTRHHVSFEGMEWMIDEYRGDYQGVVIAEIGLPADAASFPCPPWIGAEVTEDADYQTDHMIKAVGLRRKRVH